jgi:hypothetical protein
VCGLLGAWPASAQAASAPAAQLDLVTPFHVEYGVNGVNNADGRITWSNRAVRISGTVTAKNVSFTVEFVGYNTGQTCKFDQTRTASPNTEKVYGFTETCNVVGGFRVVDVYLLDNGGRRVASQTLTR